MIKYFLFIISLSFVAYAGGLGDKIAEVKGLLAVLGAAGVGVGTIIFVITNLIKIYKKVGTLIEHLKLIAEKFKLDEDVKKLLKEADEILEIMAKMAKRFGQVKLSKKLSDIIKLDKVKEISW